MQIQQINNKNMDDQPAESENNTSKISHKTVEVIKSYYNKHFPTDRKTYNLRIPFVGLILSALTMYYATKCFTIKYYFRNEENNILLYLAIFVAAAVGYELYYGLKIGDRKQFTPWILLKAIELCLTFATIVYILSDGWRLRFDFPYALLGLILFALNGLITYVVITTSRKMFGGCGRRIHTPEESFEDGDDV